MRRAVLWLYHYAYWLGVHRNFGRARFCTEHEMGAWK
ncbi:hypothetical protein E5CHR_04484 [Variovorax sp. PBL-E5]|nr:hypothetical protein E5CHR_04484 [Variovorax sp. PBL-E5]